MLDTSTEWAGLRLDRPRVMGILNVTPDSFSDGGTYFTPQSAIEAGRQLLAQGADLIDIGGESTRPGAALISPQEEAARIIPVITALAAEGAVISVDTRNASTMAAGLDAGARIINDISALTHDSASLKLVAARACPVVLMHMRGTPTSMTQMNQYGHVVDVVMQELCTRRAAALQAGVKANNICLDPGFGFAKQGGQNIALLRATRRFADLGAPLLVALSRKRFLGEISGETEARDRDPETLAACLYAVSLGAHILRVHDVGGTVRALRVWQTLTERHDG